MTSKVQMNCMKAAVNAGKIDVAVKIACLANIELNSNGLFVDNAKYDAMQAGMTALQFAGGLSALTSKGFYQASQDPEYKGTFGYWTESDTE